MPGLTRNKVKVATPQTQERVKCIESLSDHAADARRSNLHEEAFHGGMKGPESGVERRARLGRLPDADHAVAVLYRQLLLIRLGEISKVPGVREYIVHIGVVFDLEAGGDEAKNRVR